MRNWHVYWHWEHVLEQKTVTKEGFPFRSPYVDKLPKYSENMCPRTKDLLLRLGTIGISPTDTPEWASGYAAKLNAGFKRVFS